MRGQERLSGELVSMFARTEMPAGGRGRGDALPGREWVPQESSVLPGTLWGTARLNEKSCF